MFPHLGPELLDVLLRMLHRDPQPDTVSKPSIAEEDTAFLLHKPLPAHVANVGDLPNTKGDEALEAELPPA